MRGRKKAGAREEEPYRIYSFYASAILQLGLRLPNRRELTNILFIGPLITRGKALKVQHRSCETTENEKEAVCLPIVRPAPAWRDSLAHSASLGRETLPEPALGALRAWSRPIYFMEKKLKNWAGRSVRAQAVDGRRSRRTAGGEGKASQPPCPLRLASVARHTASFPSLPATAGVPLQFFKPT